VTDGEIAELLRLVIARPDDHDALRVYADALIERGDVRGELIVVQLQRRVGDSPELVARERELVERLDAELAAHLAQPRAAFAWRNGFLEAIDFTPVAERTTLADPIRQLGVLSAARKLRRIVIRLVEPGWGSLGPVTSAIAKVAPQLRALRELVFTMSPRDEAGVPLRPMHFGTLEPLCRAIPKLEVLEVAGADYATLRDLDLSSLKRLVLEDPTAGWVVSALARTPLANLEELEIHDGNWEHVDLVELLERALPLRHLALVSANPEVVQNLARVVPASVLFRKVRTFTLGGVPLDTACVETLLRHAPRLRQLARFEIDGTFSGEHRRLVDALGDIVVVR